MIPEQLLEEFDTYNFEYFMNKALSRVPEGLDTREGAIIYDALAPAAWSFTEMAQNVKNVFISTYTQTAQGEFLDRRAQEKGLSRIPATNIEVEAKFTDPSGQPFNVDLGLRFSSIGDNPVYYIVDEKITDGTYSLKASIAGDAGNRYTGQILPVDNISGLGYATITKVTIPARDEETDDDLRARILADVGLTEYGGNVADYLQMVVEKGDVGAAQIYPTWNGGGTVRVVILDNQFNPASTSLISEVQETLDPKDSSGNGYGLAPIGHTVTVAGPTSKVINISMKVSTEVGLTYVDVTPAIQTALNDFFLNMRKQQWATIQNGRSYALKVFIAQISAAILGVSGVVNVSDLTLNNAAKDITLTFSNTLQEVPILGSVTVNG